MSFVDVKNVQVVGVSAAVPQRRERNADFFLNQEDFKNFLLTTGIECRRVSDSAVCSSDLCAAAAEKLIAELEWDKEDIDILVFVSQTPDYITPATSCVLQNRLGLNKDCYTLDISLGCSGWVYALSVITSLMQNGWLRKGLLLAGDTVTKFCSKQDKSTYPLFGDAGTATALLFKESVESMKFSFNTDGEGFESIIINDGAYRNPVSEESLNMIDYENGIVANELQLKLDGMNVFSFGISKAPNSVNGLIEKFKVDKSTIDYFLFHQANLFMNEKIRKKLKLSAEQTPYSLKEYGNTSCASIPLTMVVEIKAELINRHLHLLACGFGVGLSWGSVYLETDKIVIPELIEL